MKYTIRALGIATLLVLGSSELAAAPPCDESRGYFEVFGYCRAMNVWDFTPTPRNSGIYFAGFGEGTDGGASGGSSGGSSGAGAAGASAGAAGASAGAGGASGAGAAGGDGGDSGGDSGGGDAGPGCGL